MILLDLSAELARSLEAYSKNHFPSGFYSVACSQFPLNPQPTATDIAEPESMAPDEAAPAEDLIPTAAEGEPSAETAVETMDVEDDVDVTDVVDELVNSGDLEPSSTPAVGHVDSKGDISDPERLEALDEAVEEEKEREEEEERENGEGNVVEKISEPKAEEEDGPKLPEEEEEEIEKKIEGLNVEEKKQERIENPLYTLEVVGNRYNPSNFWWVVFLFFARSQLTCVAGRVDGVPAGLLTKQLEKSMVSSTLMFITTNKAMFSLLLTTLLPSRALLSLTALNPLHPR